MKFLEAIVDDDPPDVLAEGVEFYRLASDMQAIHTFILFSALLCRWCRGFVPGSVWRFYFLIWYLDGYQFHGLVISFFLHGISGAT